MTQQKPKGLPESQSFALAIMVLAVLAGPPAIFVSIGNTDGTTQVGWLVFGVSILLTGILCLWAAFGRVAVLWLFAFVTALVALIGLATVIQGYDG